MNSIYISASAFKALNIPNDLHHQDAVEYVQSLFSQTIQTFSSSVEIILAAKHIQDEVSHEKMLHFLKLCDQGSIQLLPLSPLLVQKPLADLIDDHPTDLYPPMTAGLMHTHGIKHIFTFDERFKDFQVITHPDTDHKD